MSYRFVFAVVALAWSSSLRADLIANVTAVTGPSSWSYTLFNNEPLTSPNFISSFSLTVDAPITVTGTPTGWDFSTDNSTFVFWFNTDAALPYPNDIAPGASLAGFSLTSTVTSSQSLSYGLTGWDHSLDQPGPTTSDFVHAPSTTSSTVPEPASFGLGTLALLLIISVVFLRLRNSRDRKVVGSDRFALGKPTSDQQSHET